MKNSHELLENIHFRCRAYHIFFWIHEQDFSEMKGNTYTYFKVVFFECQQDSRTPINIKITSVLQSTCALHILIWCSNALSVEYVQEKDNEIVEMPLIINHLTVLGLVDSVSGAGGFSSHHLVGSKSRSTMYFLYSSVFG